MKELLARIFANRLVGAELLAASLFANVLALASPIFVIQVLNRYIAYGVDSTLATLTAGVLVAVALEFGFRQVRQRLAQAVTLGPDAALARGAFGVLTTAKAAQLEGVSPGLRREVMQGVDTIQNAYAPANIATVLDLPFALVFVGALFLLSPPLALIVVVVLAVVFTASTLAQASLRTPVRELTGAQGARGGVLGSALGELDTVRAFNLAVYLHKAWEDTAGKVRGIARRIAARQTTVQSGVQSAQALMSVAIYAFGATLVVKGEINVGALIGANILAARALGPIAGFARLSETFAKAAQSRSMITEFLRLPRERSEGSALREYAGKLELHDLAFAWSGSSGPLFESLSLTLEPGDILIVTGGNGTGKTTLARLLLGLLEPTRGQVLVDGVDLAQMVPEWWRKQVVYMPQEARFLAASLRDNLTAVNADLDDEAINRLVDVAGLRSYVDHSPEGLETQIVGSGDNLSLGIRRRLALARALAHDGRLAVLDEPTEGLDADGAMRVYAVMNDLARRGRTIVAFSHDPNIVKGARWTLDLNAKPVPALSEARPAPAPAQGGPA